MAFIQTLKGLISGGVAAFRAEVPGERPWRWFEAWRQICKGDTAEPPSGAEAPPRRQLRVGGGAGGGPATCLISPPFSRCPCYLFRTKSIINFIYHVSSCCVIDYAIDAVLLYLAFSRKQENARLASHVHSRRRVSCFPCSSVGSGVVTRPNLGPQSGTLRAGRFWCHKELKIRERHTASHRFHVGPSWAARSSSEIQ